LAIELWLTRNETAAPTTTTTTTTTRVSVPRTLSEDTAIPSGLSGDSSTTVNWTTCILPRRIRSERTLADHACTDQMCRNVQRFVYGGCHHWVDLTLDPCFQGDEGLGRRSGDVPCGGGVIRRTWWSPGVLCPQCAGAPVLLLPFRRKYLTLSSHLPPGTLKSRVSSAAAQYSKAQESKYHRIWPLEYTMEKRNKKRQEMDTSLDCRRARSSWPIIRARSGLARHATICWSISLARSTPAIQASLVRVSCCSGRPGFMERWCWGLTGLVSLPLREADV